MRCLTTILALCLAVTLACSGRAEEDVRPQTFRYKRRLFEALREQGFTEEQALTIVVADRPPLAELRVQESEP